jgi:hypothetical protein
MLFTANEKKQFDKRVTLDKKYKQPYGTKVFFDMLPVLLPNRTVEVNKKPPEDWFYGNDGEIDSTLFIIVSQHFNPTSSEMLLLKRFVNKGNQVLIIAPQFDNTAQDFFGLEIVNSNYIYYENYKDSPKVMLHKPVFAKDTTYTYPGFTFNTYFSDFKTSRLQVLGTEERGYPNFIKGNIGKGSFYLHSNPFVFTNYFILHKNNKDYLEKTFALIPTSVKRVVWDEYFVYKLAENEKAKEPSPLRVLLNIPAFKWAFWVAILFLALYMLLNAKRNQRLIPDYKKPQNESLDFVKTIGRLYFEKQDHINLAQKMSAYFLENIRSKYFINTSALNEAFIQKLIGKSGCEENEIRQLIQIVADIHLANSISQEQLTQYYKQFKNFYKNTA